ncbi:hypothetical protein [Bradyrhizobium japonicum]|uniref:hypothetical protein n=1 Tax=Bradyrhizobium japonicum TaxID=375 RepID=UPI0013747567
MTTVTENPSSDSTSAIDSRFRRHTSHRGAFSVCWRGDEIEVRPLPDDPDPNRIIENFPAALRHRTCVIQPMVRRRR